MRTLDQRRYRTSKFAGLCTMCHTRTAIQNKTYCLRCRKIQSTRYHKSQAKKRRNGTCLKCPRKRLKYTPFCRTCWVKTVARGWGHGYRLNDLLVLWAAQDGRCAYTGHKLIPGKTASIDHIIPKASKGTNDIENLQWVTLDVNRAKRALTHKEFLGLCNDVVQHTKEN